MVAYPTEDEHAAYKKKKKKRTKRRLLIHLDAYVYSRKRQRSLTPSREKRVKEYEKEKEEG
jgi:hypothetical protein